MADSRIYTATQQFASSGNFTPEYTDATIKSNLPYATDLLAFAHKYKFLFLVDILIDPVAVVDTPSDTRFALLCQTSTRPSPKFDYDQVNLYGARTAVLQKTKFSEMKMTFIDDQQNKMMDFYACALRWQSPIVNMSTNAAYDLLQYDFKLNQGQNLDGQNSYSDNSHQYAVSSNPTPFLKQITLYHVYDYGNLVNIYNFSRPLLTDLQLDELDMKSPGELSVMSISFDYIAFDLQLAVPFTQEIATKVGPVSYTLMQNQ